MKLREAVIVASQVFAGTPRLGQTACEVGFFGQEVGATVSHPTGLNEHHHCVITE
ncbi:MAG: hypothetical protein R2706_11880 [Acidimicrobiales bacterium]